LASKNSNVTDSTDSLEEEIEEKPVTLTAVIKEEEVALLHHSDNLPKILRLTVYL